MKLLIFFISVNIETKDEGIIKNYNFKGDL